MTIHFRRLCLNCLITYHQLLRKKQTNGKATTANANHPNTRGPEAHVARKSVNDNLFNSHQNYHINNRNETLRLENRRNTTNET